LKFTSTILAIAVASSLFGCGGGGGSTIGNQETSTVQTLSVDIKTPLKYTTAALYERKKTFELDKDGNPVKETIDNSLHFSKVAEVQSGQPLSISKIVIRDKEGNGDPIGTHDYYVVVNGAGVSAPGYGLLTCLVGGAYKWDKTAEKRTATCDAATTSLFAMASAQEARTSGINKDEKLLPPGNPINPETGLTPLAFAAWEYANGYVLERFALLDLAAETGLIYSAFLDKGQQYIAPGVGHPLALLLNGAFESLRQISGFGVITTKMIQDTYIGFAPSVFDYAGTSQENVTAYYALISNGVPGVSLNQARNLVVPSYTIALEHDSPPAIKKFSVIIDKPSRTATVSWASEQLASEYVVYLNYQQVAVTTKTSWSFPNLIPGQKYTVSISPQNFYGRTPATDIPVTIEEDNATAAPAEVATLGAVWAGSDAIIEWTYTANYTGNTVIKRDGVTIYNGSNLVARDAIVRQATSQTVTYTAKTEAGSTTVTKTLVVPAL
jgi:hypothetical protein